MLSILPNNTVWITSRSCKNFKTTKKCPQLKYYKWRWMKLLKVFFFFGYTIISFLATELLSGINYYWYKDFSLFKVKYGKFRRISRPFNPEKISTKPVVDLYGRIKSKPLRLVDHTLIKICILDLPYKSNPSFREIFSG